LLALVQIGLAISVMGKLPTAPSVKLSSSPFHILSNDAATAPPNQVAPSSITAAPDSTSFLSAPAISSNAAFQPPIQTTAPVISSGVAVNTTTKAAAKSQRPVLPPGGEIRDPRISETVEAAREVRKMGDMKTALEALRKADLHEPNHPEILSEMALTYEAMGLAEKSQAEWHRVAAMGEKMAGGYFLLARSKLDGAPVDPAGAASSATEPKPIALGICELKRDFTYTIGEKVTLRIPVKPVAGQSVHAKGINPEVFLFDQFADGRVVQSVATQSPARWIPGVVDWTNPLGAVVEMDFTLPAQTAEFARTHGGVRKIYGYMVKLYHDYRLMGEQAEPELLLNYKQQVAAPVGADNALFPRN